LDSHNFTPLFVKLRERVDIKNNLQILTELNAIERYSENDREQAYLLGLFVKKNKGNLLSETENIIIRDIKTANLEHQFHKLSDTDKLDSLRFISMTYIFTIVGIALLFFGLIQLYNGDFSYGLGTKYLGPIIREGGYKVIFGIMLLVGGLIRIKHERRKNLLIKMLASKI
jgi:hypothetical protein